MKVLADTSVWIDHLRKPDERLQTLLGTGGICIHPVVVGELACGSIKNRDQFLTQLLKLPLLREGPFLTTLRLIQSDRLWARGLAWSDIQILLSCQSERGGVMDARSSFTQGRQRPPNLAAGAMNQRAGRILPG